MSGWRESGDDFNHLLMLHSPKFTEFLDPTDRNWCRDKSN